MLKKVSVIGVSAFTPFLAFAQSIGTDALDSALGTSTAFAIASTGILIKYVFLVLGVTLAVALGIGLLYWGIRKAVSAVHGRH